MISLVSFAFVSADKVAHSLTSVARRAPSTVEGQSCFSTTGALFEAAKWAGFVLVTS
jgi:hypothetical protein